MKFYQYQIHEIILSQIRFPNQSFIFIEILHYIDLLHITPNKSFSVVRL